MKDYLLSLKKPVYKTVCDIIPLDVKNILKTLCVCVCVCVFTRKGLDRHNERFRIPGHL